MQISLGTDAMSYKLQSNLSLITKAMNKSAERISTGLKVNHASDGAAILSISQKISSQISGDTIAKDNIQQGVLLLEQADSGLQNINADLGKIRDLLVQAASTSSSSERNTLKTQALVYLDDLNSIAENTSFNDLNLLDGSITEMYIQTGANSGDRVDISAAFAAANGDSIGVTNTGLANAFSSQYKANQYLTTIDNAINQISTQLGTEGAYDSSLNTSLSGLATKIANYESSFSTLMDTDIAAETSRLTNLQILQEANVSLLAQLNSQKELVLKLLE